MVSPKSFLIASLVGLAATFFAGCSTGYQQQTFFSYTGGFVEKDLGRDVHRVEYGANGFTSQETAQCFWLYRCAELTLEKGFDGFEIISDIRLTKSVSPYEAFGLPEPTFEMAQYYVPIIIPTDNSSKPYIHADILMLKGEIQPAPPKKFNAHKLKLALEPHVADAIKSRKNVKPHVHDYLLPEGKLEKSL